MQRGSITFGALAVLSVFSALALGAVSINRQKCSIPPKPKPARPDSPVQAAAFRFEARMSEDGTWPENALMTAKAQRDALAELSQNSDFGPSSFTWYGPGNVGGRLRGILVNPNNNQQMWVGSCSGGIWKTTNGGTSWTPVNDFMPNLVVGCMTMEPGNPNVMYTGTGEGFFETVEGSTITAAIRGAGIFKSTDMGTTWTQMASTTGPDWYFVNRIAIDPTNPSIILAATGAGIFRSTNGGLTWTKTYNDTAFDLQFDPTDHNRILAGVHEHVGIIRSTDNGQTWSNTTGITNSHRAEIRWAPATAGMVYANVTDDSGSLNNQPLRVWRSTDFGQTWVQRTTSSITTYSAYNSVLWVDPTNSNTLIVGSVNLYRSTNGGQSLSTTFSGAHSDHHVILQDPGFNGSTNRILYFGTDGGIYKTTDYTGSTVTNLNNGLGVTQFYGAAMHPTSNIMIAGAQDNGTNRYTGNAAVWTKNVIGGDGGFCASDPTDANYFYGESQYLGLGRSSNGGSSFSGITSGVTDAGSQTLCNFIPFFMLDPNNPNTMYACCRRLWRTNNVKAATPTWTAIKPSIESDGNGDSHFASNSPFNISTCAVAQGSPNIVYVGYNNGQIWRSTDANNANPSWTRVGQSSGLPGRWVSKIAIDPNNANRVYASYLGWESDNVWKSGDGGNTWAPINGVAPRMLPSAPASSIAVDPQRPGRLFVGTDVGVFSTVDDGVSWSTSNEGPANVAVDELAWRNNTSLIVTTYGRGVYLANITPLTTQVGPDSFTISIGKRKSGNLLSLVTADDNRLVVLPLRSSSGARGTAQVIAEATSPSSVPLEIRFRVESSIAGGSANQTMALYNFQTQQYVNVDIRAASGSDVSIEAIVNTNVSQYVDPVTKKIRGRLTYEQSAASPQWEMRIDHMNWTVQH